MTKEMWVTLLTVLATLLTLATQMLPIPTNVTPFLLYAVAAINAILAIVFGVASYRQIKARAVSKQK